MKKLIYSSSLALILLTFNGCGKSDSSSVESASELAAAAAVGGSQGGSNVGYNMSNPPPTLLAKMQSALNPVSEAFAAVACPYYQAGSTVCAGNAVTFNYANCSFGANAATWAGSQTLSFSGTATCNTNTLPLTGAGAVLTRTFGSGTTRTSAGGVVVNLDSSTPSGFSSSVSGGFTINGTAGGHNVVINGLHMVASVGGVTRWDHTVNTDPANPLSVTFSGGSRTFNSGIVVVQHNLAKYVANASISNVVVAAGSCFPSSGSVTTTFVAGSKSGTETLKFNGGTSATLTNPDGSTASVTLTHCF